MLWGGFWMSACLLSLLIVHFLDKRSINGPELRLLIILMNNIQNPLPGDYCSILYLVRSKHVLY